MDDPHPKLTPGMLQKLCFRGSGCSLDCSTLLPSTTKSHRSSGKTTWKGPLGPDMGCRVARPEVPHPPTLLHKRELSPHLCLRANSFTNVTAILCLRPAALLLPRPPCPSAPGCCSGLCSHLVGCLCTERSTSKFSCFFNWKTKRTVTTFLRGMKGSLEGMTWHRVKTPWLLTGKAATLASCLTQGPFGISL